LQQFYDEKTGKVGPATQGSQSFAVFSDLLTQDEQRTKAMNELLVQIDKKDRHLATGIFATRFMLNVLSKYGHADTAYQIVNQKTFPGWGYMLENGATTLWEHWAGSNSMYSHNHPMFGSVSEWFYQWLGGIQPAPDAAGFDKIWIRPQVIPGLEWVRCSYDSVRGKIESNWQCDGETLKMDITIPANTSALVFLPESSSGEIKEGGKNISELPEIIKVPGDTGPLLKIGSGHYRFEIPIK
jgi:alpha-L-rhamnosidase